jgi:hypothetical protein
LNTGNLSPADIDESQSQVYLKYQQLKNHHPNGGVMPTEIRIMRVKENDLKK